MVKLRPYPRGFVIIRKNTPAIVPEGWSKLPLANSGWIFAYDPSETPVFAPVTTGNQWVMVYGLCLYAGTDEREMTPEQRLAESVSSGEQDFLDLLDLLGGRYVVLVGDDSGFKLYQDATGMRSVFFSPNKYLVASHAHLLNDVAEHEERTPAQGSENFLRSWERTPFIGLDALLPNHSLSLPEFKVTRFYPRQENKYIEWTLEDRISEFQRLWKRQWQSLGQFDLDIIMSLTGGTDSRTSLALLSNHMDTIKTFTYTVSKPSKSGWAASVLKDRVIVDQIKNCLNLNHTYITNDELEKTGQSHLSSVIDKNSISVHGKWLLPHYLNNFPGENVLHIRGNVYAIFKAPWRRRKDKDTLAVLRKQYDVLTSASETSESKECRDQHFQDSIRRWEYENDLMGFHRLELLYWEIRLGRWASEIYNETDVAFNSMEPVNVRELLEISMSFSMEDKKNQYFQTELINISYPLLNFPGKNDTRNLYEQTRDKDREPTQLGRNEHLLQLERGMKISSDDQSLIGSSDMTATGPNEILIPSGKFLSGTMVSKAFQNMPTSGSLRFTVISPYSNTAAGNTWYYQVSIDEIPYARWDGALHNRPSHVTIDNVLPETKIEFQVVAVRDHRNQESWELASKATIKDIVFTQEMAQGSPRLAIDEPGSAL